MRLRRPAMGTRELVGRLDGATALRLLEPADDVCTEVRALARRRTPHRRGWLMRRMLLGADVVALLIAFLVAEVVFGYSRRFELVLFVAALPAWAVAARLAGLYERDIEWTDYSTTRELVTVFNIVTAGVWSAAVVAGGFHHRLVFFWLLSPMLVVGARVTARVLCRQSLAYRQNALVVGAGEI